MLKRLTLAALVLLATGLLLLVLVPARAADDNVPSGKLITASSGNVAAATATATLTAQSGFLNRLCSFKITSAGATGAAVVSPTVTGVAGGTMTYTYAVVAGVTVANPSLNVQFSPCVPATGPNVAIAMSLPSLSAATRMRP